MKQTITILHGWSYSLEKWHPCIELLEHAGYSCNLLAIPGLTATMPTTTAWTVADYVQWLDDTLAPNQRHILLGHSNGGRIALAYTHRFPLKVQAMVLIASAGVPHRDLRTQAKKLFFATCAKVGKALTRSEFLKKLLYRLAREHDYYQATPLMKQTMRNLLAEDSTTLLPEITTPTLLLWGAQDTATPLTDAHTLQAGLRNSQLIVVPHAKHSPHFTHTQIVVEHITQYLSHL